MNIIYGIQCHKNKHQIIELIKSINLESNDYVIIHVDKKCDLLFEELCSFYSDKKNVIILYNRVSVSWSGFSQVRATLLIIEEVINKNIAYDYFVLLSGEDCLLKDSCLLKRFLTVNNKSFVDFRNDVDDYFWRVNSYNFFRESKYNRTFFLRVIAKVITYFQKLWKFKRLNFADEEIHLGSSWFIMREDHLIKIMAELNEEFISLFDYTSCADEHFFQILFKKKINDDEYFKNNLHYICFNKGHNSPEYLTIDELNNINNDNYFFARKVTGETLKKWNKIK